MPTNVLCVTAQQGIAKKYVRKAARQIMAAFFVAILLFMSGMATGQTTQTFTYTGAAQSFTVPPGVTSMTVKLWGAGGGAASYKANGGSGGSGAYVTGTLSVTPGQALTIIVGGGGGASTNVTTAAPGGYGGGGNGGSSGNAYGGGGGGGRSAIQITAGTDNVTAGGGGGGGGYAPNYYPSGGGGGINGLNQAGASGGAGAGLVGTAAGASGGVGYSNTGGVGSQYQGGAGANAATYLAGGGGGGGYYGGSGGGSNNTATATATRAQGGGGGGTSLTNNSSFTVTTSANGTTSSLGAIDNPNASDPNYLSGVGVGPAGTVNPPTNGGNGLVVLTFTEEACPAATAVSGSITLTPGASGSGQIGGSFAAVTPAPSGYLVVRTAFGTNAGTPVTGTTYVPGVSGLGGIIVSTANSTTFTDYGLTPGSQYTYTVFSYNNFCIGGPVYASGLSGSATAASCTNGTRTLYWGGEYSTLTGATTSLTWSTAGNWSTSSTTLTGNVATAPPDGCTVTYITTKGGALNILPLVANTEVAALTVTGSGTAPELYVDADQYNLNILGNLSMSCSTTSYYALLTIGNGGSITVGGTATIGGSADAGQSLIGNSEGLIPATFIFNGNVTFGKFGGTDFSAETNAVFNGGTESLGSTGGAGYVSFANITVNGNLTMAGTAADYIYVDGGGLTLGPGASLTLPSTYTLNQEQSTGGALTLGAGATLNVNGAAVTGSTNYVTGSNFPGGFSYYNLTGGTVSYGASTANQTIYNPAAYGNLTIADGSSYAATAGTGLTINGNVLINNNATFNGGSSLSHTVGGNWTNNGTFTYTTANTITFNGSGLAQTIAGSTTFYNLSFSNSSGLSLTGSTGVGHTLTFPATPSSGLGLITTGSNAVVMGASATISGFGYNSNSDYVNGNLSWSYTSATNHVFPIGNAGTYLPITFTYNTTPTNSTVTLFATAGSYAPAIPSSVRLYTGAYWTLSQTSASAINYSLTIPASGFTPATGANVVILKSDNSATATSNATTGTYTNATAFTTIGSTNSQFALGQTAIPLTITSGVTANDKVYDGTVNGPGAGAGYTIGTVVFSGAVGGDALTLVSSAATETFAGTGVGTGIAITAAGFTVSGTNAGAYTLVQPTGLTASITKASLTASLVGTITKTYDGTTTATPAGANESLSGIVSGDALKVAVTSYSTANYDTKDVGTSKTVTVTGLVLGGTAAGNYMLSNAATVSAAVGKINPANATISVTPYSVTYDGNAHTATGTATGVQGEDLSSLLTLSGTTHTAAGTYNGDAWTFAGNTDYNPASGTVNDAIGQATPTLSITGTPTSFTYTGSAQGPTVTVTNNSGGAQTFSYTSTDGGGYLASTAPINVGAYQVTVSVAATANYKAAGPSNAVAFMIGKATPTLSITGTPTTFTYTGSAQGPTVTVTNNSGGAQTFSYTSTDGGGYSGSTAPINVGAYQVTVSVAATSNYKAAGPSNAVAFSIGQATGTVSITGTPTSFTYTGSAQGPTVTVTTNSGGTQTFSYTSTDGGGYSSSTAPVLMWGLTR